MYDGAPYRLPRPRDDAQAASRARALLELHEDLGLSSMTCTEPVAESLYEVATGARQIDEEDMERIVDHIDPGYLDEVIRHATAEPGRVRTTIRITPHLAMTFGADEDL